MTESVAIMRDGKRIRKQIYLTRNFKSRCVGWLKRNGISQKAVARAVPGLHGLQSFKYIGEDERNPCKANFAPIFAVKMLGKEPSGRVSGAMLEDDQV